MTPTGSANAGYSGRWTRVVIRARGDFVVLATTTVVILAALVVIGHGYPGPASVYSVAQVKAGLSGQPTAWGGQTVSVRGIVVTIHHSIFGAGLALSSVGPAQTTVLAPDIPGAPHSETALLSSIFNARTSAVLLLRPQTTDPIMTALQHVPVVGTLFHRPRRVTSYTPAIYRLQLLAPQQSCLHDQCADAVLLDATP